MKEMRGKELFFSYLGDLVFNIKKSEKCKARKQQRKSMKRKAGSSTEVNKIDDLPARLMKTKREKTQIINIKNKIGMSLQILQSWKG